MSRILVVGDVVDDVLVRPVGPTTIASDTVATIEQRPGGSAANVAAWLGHAGADVAFIGRAGSEAATRHRTALAAYGVDATIAADASRPAATIVALVDDAGERTMYVDRGANSGLVIDDLPTTAWAGVSWLHLTGHTFFDPATRPVAQHLMRQASQRGVAVSVDPSSSAFLRAVTPDCYLAWTSGAALTTPNLDEAAALTGTGAPEPAARALLRHYPEVVVTCGRDGVLWCGGAGDPVWAAATTSEAVDTTGAGDAFCAGLLAARSEQAPLTEQLAAGVRLAAEAAGQVGARPGQPR